MKTAVVTFNSPKYQTVSLVTHPTMKAYADKIGAEFVSMQIADGTADVRLLAKSLFTAYDRIIYLDGDLIIRDDTPSLFEIVPKEKVGAVMEGRFIPQAPRLNQLLHMVGHPKAETNSLFFGCGVLVASKEHESIFEKVDKLGPIQDKFVINFNLIAKDVPVYFLNYRFNYQHFMDIYTGEVRHNAYIIHYSGALKGLTPAQLSEIVQSDLDVWKKSAPEYKFKKNIKIIVEGGLGDEIAAIPTARYVINNLYKGDNIIIVCHTPYVFSHLNVPVYRHHDIIKDGINYHPLRTLQNPDTPIWSHISHTLTNATDYASISALRMQLPLSEKQITLPANEKARDNVLGILKKFNANLDKLIVVHPGKGWKTKTFPKHIWDGYIQEIQKQIPDSSIVIIGKTISKEQGFVDVDNDKCIDLRDKIELPELIELIRLCKVLLTNDSSPVHIAGDSDCWLVTIATCKHPEYIFPYRNQTIKYKTLSLERNFMYYDYERRPTAVEGSTINNCTDERLLECLPDKNDLAHSISKILI
jgi:hypothetical protein